MTDTIEHRAFECTIEYRAAPEGSTSPGTLVGHAAVFNQLSRDLGGWYEEIDPGGFGANAADGSLDMVAHNRVMARSEHDSRLLLGTTDAGTLRLFIDDIGLGYEVDLPNTTAGRDAGELAQRGEYRYSSFAFSLIDAVWREDGEGRLIRRNTNMRLIDVAPVANPAYWGATVGKRDFTPDLGAVRAQLHPAPAGPGDRERSAVDLFRANNDRLRDFRSGTRARSVRGKELR
jgi:HK97 family phage prohead protease